MPSHDRLLQVPVHTPPGVARPRRHGGGSRAGLILPPPGSGPGSGDPHPRRLLHPARGLRGDHPALPGHARGRGRLSSRPPSPPPASRAAPSRAGCRPISSPFPSSRTSPAWSKPGLVAEDWNADEYKGMVTDSVVVLAVRLTTRRASPPGTTCSRKVSRSSPRTRSPRAAPAGTSWPPTAPSSSWARPRKRRSSTCASSSRTSRCWTRARVSRWRPSPVAKATC